MTKFYVDGADLTSVANEIRSKGGTSESLTFPAGFVSAIEAIETGGGGGTDLKSLFDQLKTKDGKFRLVIYANAGVEYYFPVYSNSTRGCTVDWGDGTTETTPTESFDGVTHTWASSGAYLVVFTPANQGSSSEAVQLSLRWSSDTGTQYAYGHTPILGAGNSLASDSHTTLQERLGLFFVFDACPGRYSGNDLVYRDCFNLETVVLDYSDANGSISIRDYSFNNCESLQNVTLSDNISDLGRSTFYACYALKQITLPAQLTSLKYAVFQNCRRLESITIPDSVTSIEDRAFMYTVKLTKIIITKTSEVIPLGGTQAFYGSAIETGTGYVYVPDELVDSYKAATNWSSYASQIKGLSELPA